MRRRQRLVWLPLTALVVLGPTIPASAQEATPQPAASTLAEAFGARLAELTTPKATSRCLDGSAACSVDSAAVAAIA